VINLAGTQRGEYDATTTQVFGDVGHSFAFGSVSIEPFANLAYVRVGSGIRETGFAAVSGDAKIDTTYTTLGARGAVAVNSALTARGTLAWRHAFGDVVPAAMLAFQSGSTTFSLAGSPIARNAVVAEAGADLAVAPNATIGVSWNGQFGDGNKTNAVKRHFNWKF
jgi:outer membrane autotransporter protein